MPDCGVTGVARRTSSSHTAFAPLRPAAPPRYLLSLTASIIMRIQEITVAFQPVMRRFFTEKFAMPEDWFERRLAYTRSAATSSIVGFIVGLGDRHPQNILIDTGSAELVHIDLGVAFDQVRG